MHSSTEFAPSPTAAASGTPEELASFAAFLEKLANADVLGTPTRSVTVFESVPEEEAAALSYEHLLRKPATVPTVPPANPFTALATATQGSTALAAPTERRNTRASICLSERERDLLRERASESSLSVSAYVRSCIFEVEALREQVKQFVAQMQAQPQATTAPQPAIAAPPPAPVLSAPPLQAALPGRQELRPQQPALTRTPQPTPRYSNPRVQSAIEAQKHLASQKQAHKPESKPNPKPGLFGFFFGARKNA